MTFSRATVRCCMTAASDAQLIANPTLVHVPRALVMQACNHNRITDICNDIGMVQVLRGGVHWQHSCALASAAACVLIDHCAPPARLPYADPGED